MAEYYHTESDPLGKTALPQTVNYNKSKNKLLPNSSKSPPPTLDAVSECDSSSSVSTVRRNAADKEVTASSSNIDLYNVLNASDNYVSNGQIFVDSSGPLKLETHKPMILPIDTEMTVRRDPKVGRRDKFPRQNHRVKVRSPRRRSTPESIKTENDAYASSVKTITEGVMAIDWDQEIEEYIDHVNEVPVDNENVERMSCHSLDDMCRICHGGEALSPELGQMISACACRGTVGRVHVKCLERWLTESGKSRCELCGTRYATRRVHRYGLPKALVMWMLSQNAKQLMVDSLGIMLMSPLAVLAAWLSGRTLAGLMTPDSQVTPWPLASTFVLACMTLVCYYCWIVSAATRHALGWWIWYRSQYEVRLQFHENEE